MEDFMFEFEETHIETEFGDPNIDSPLDNILSPTFKGGNHIDDLYDPHIKDVHDSFDRHLEDLNNAKTEFELNQAERNLQNDISSERFWENAKREAEIQAEKDRIFLDDINAKLDIIEKYRKK